MPEKLREGDLLIDVRDLSVAADGKDIIHGVTFGLRRGEIVTVIGPNGAGKSTLVRAILGLVRLSRGAVVRQPGITMGYVPQHLQIERTMPITVRRFLRISPAARDIDLTSLMDEVGALHVLDRDFQDLSGGEVKRVLLARALASRPDLLVLDEPTANIDVPGQAEFYDLIRRIRDQDRCGILLVSHDLHLVMGATDTVLCLNGHVCCQGAPESVVRQPEYLALFGPELGRSFGVYTHEHDHHHDVHGEAVPHDAVEDESANA